MNLGGFSNVSFEQNGNRIAFYASEYRFKFLCQSIDLDYDDKGALARTGTCNHPC
jgi:anhydro-N-acetylmuramic acid kinase